MARNSVFLDVDPSIIERNMMISRESNAEDELNSVLNHGEMPSKLVKPSPGFCVKSLMLGINKKIFINVCHTDAIPPPEDISFDELMRKLESEDPVDYRIPMSVGEGHDEMDKSGKSATVYDIAINPKFLEKVEKNDLFRTFFLTVVFEALQDKYQIELDMKKYTILKNRKSIGSMHSHRIQIRNQQQVPKAKPLIEEIVSESLTAGGINQKLVIKKKNDVQYRLYREPSSGEMQFLIGEFKIANTVHLKDLHLDIGEDRIILNCKEYNPVDIFVPCKIGKVNASLDRNKGVLTVKMASYA